MEANLSHGAMHGVWMGPTCQPTCTNFVVLSPPLIILFSSG